VTAAPAGRWQQAVLRAEIDAVLAEWAWHLDHGDYAAVAGLFTEDAVFVTGAVELRGRAAIENRYAERVVARSTRHMYSGLRISLADGGGAPPGQDSPVTDSPAGHPARVRARSTWVNYAVNAPVPAEEVGVYLVADFDDELSWCADQCWRISARRITGVFRDPARAPVTG
jgi:ketosteroid isomerase-like protein